ncbi:hypothetical protein KQH21_30975 [Streptomyces sp. IpFD-1.1]|uniref:hypothetical protein n=1 Tax=Streptomyces sp. IpFD-1.1 TaxID=2841664 RepID=UPI0020960F34|nr:hypothetical protein [Streptomyces sp. IpFD-1.1]MCO6752541.1 hypothetical protein [Streptomyces sp. IpFD-1.1]
MDTPIHPGFQPGDRVVGADGVARTVRGMAPRRPHEPARVVAEDGVELIAAHCRRANREDVAAARIISDYTAALICEDPDPSSPQWKAALADLDAAMAYREAAETHPAIRAAIAEGHSSAAQDLAGLTVRSGPGADSPAPENLEETALREEAWALLAVLTEDSHAHAFQPVQPAGAERPAGWTYRTGYGANAQYGWIAARSARRGEAHAEYRWQAERAATGAAALVAAGPLPEGFADMPLDKLRTALDGIRDRAARVRGTEPRYALDQEVAAALQVLAASSFAEVPPGFNPGVRQGDRGHDPAVTGVFVVPALNGHVMAMWVEGGRYVTAAGGPFKAQLREIRRKFEEAGWTLVPGSVRVVTARRPGA